MQPFPLAHGMVNASRRQSPTRVANTTWEQLQANAGQEIGDEGCEHGPVGGKRVANVSQEAGERA